jgi:hypothetical protein
MVMNGALLLLSRSFFASMLMLVETRYFIWYSAFDMGIYLLFKMARGDFTYWIPVDGALGFFMSMIVRVGVKTITDYTGIVQFRASGELGGIYWSFSMLTAVAVPFVAEYFLGMASVTVAMAEGTASRIVGSLSGAWLFFFVLFLFLMNKEYRWTFFSFETGNEWAVSFFLKGDTDAKRVKPLRLNKNKWKKIRPQMKEFVLDNWERWEGEQPEWFTQVWKASIDDDMLPAAELRKQKLVGGGQWRRSSLGGLLVGGARDGRESATVVPKVVADVEGDEEEFHDAQDGEVVASSD